MRPGRRRAVPSLLAVACAALGCASTEPPEASGSTGGSGGGGGEGGGASGVPCPASGISKGPWSLAIEGTRATVRWEACREGTPPGLALAPEGGGAPVEATSTESPFDVIETFTAPLNPDAPPDAAGRYYMHEAALTGLAPSTCYAYTLDAAGDGAAPARFCTARASGEALRFMAIGDTNPALGDATGQILAEVLPEQPDFVLHAGDLQYYDSGLETWALWFDRMAPMLRSGGFYPAIGNHEHEKDGELEQYYARFFGGAGEGELEHYRFDSAGVSFFSLDTESELGPGSAQAAWLESGLAAAAMAPGHRLSVVYFHKPFITCGDKGDNPEAFAHLMPIFEANRVGLVIQAHMHGYERFTMGAVTFLTTGGGGGVLGAIDENVDRPYCVNRVASGAFKHAVILEVGVTLSAEVIDETGATRDAFEQPLP